MATDQDIPKWKADFPVKQEEATHVSRREFAKFLCLLSGSLALGNGLIASKPFLFPKKNLQGRHFICHVHELAIGEMTDFILNNNHRVPYILIRLEENEWRCYEQKCTHLSCAVLYDHQIKKIVCPCHKGYFDPDSGKVLQGPPPRALPALAVSVEGDKIFVMENKNV